MHIWQTSKSQWKSCYLASRSPTCIWVAIIKHQCMLYRIRSCNFSDIFFKMSAYWAYWWGNAYVSESDYYIVFWHRQTTIGGTWRGYSIMNELYDSSSQTQTFHLYQEDIKGQVPTRDFLRLLSKILFLERKRGTDLSACFLKHNIDTAWIWHIPLEYADHWARLRFHVSNTFSQKVSIYLTVQWITTKWFCTYP